MKSSKENKEGLESYLKIPVAANWPQKAVRVLLNSLKMLLLSSERTVPHLIEMH